MSLVSSVSPCSGVCAVQCCTQLIHAVGMSELLFGWIYPDVAAMQPLKNSSSSPKWAEFLHHSISHLTLFRLDCLCNFLEGPFISAFLLRPKIPMSGQFPKSVFSSGHQNLSMRISLSNGCCIWNWPCVCSTPVWKSYIFTSWCHHGMQKHLYESAQGQICRRCLCFTSSLKFCIICITTVLPIQMLVQHFSGGYSFLLVGVSGTWYHICETWSLW